MQPTLKADVPMVALILVTLWVLGLVSSYTLGGFLHLFLLAAIGMMLPRLIWGRRPRARGEPGCDTIGLESAMPRPRKKPPSNRAGRMPTFDAQSFLDSAGITKKIVEYRPLAVIFSQGDPADTVLYIQKGAVRLSVLSHAGKEAIVGMLGPGDFLGEGALAGQPVRMGTATAVSTTTALIVPKRQMIQLLHDEPGFSDRFIEFMLSRNIRIEEDLVDQLFNSSEKRLARTLLLLARYSMADKPQGVLPKLSQEMLAEMIGTTRSRVNFFMNKFRKLGFIEYNGGLKINTALLSVVLHDSSQ